MHLLQGDTGVTLPPADRSLAIGDVASAVVTILKDVLLATGTETLVVRSTKDIGYSRRDVRFNQSIRGTPVINGRLALVYEAETGHVTVMSATFLPDRGLPTHAKLSADSAA